MATREQIQKAVTNKGWQTFRLGMKGKSTKMKLGMLEIYWKTEGPGPDGEHVWGSDHGGGDCIICIRVDNYIKALCRGGQLYPGESLQTALDQKWNLRIKR